MRRAIFRSDWGTISLLSVACPAGVVVDSEGAGAAAAEAGPAEEAASASLLPSLSIGAVSSLDAPLGAVVDAGGVLTALRRWRRVCARSSVAMRVG